MFLWYILLTLCFFSVSATNDRPIIGILAKDGTSSYGDSIIPASYVKYIMMGGARVVPIRLKEPESYYQDMFNKINGLLIPGGATSVTTSEIARAANLMLTHAMQANAQGDYFPVWGICLGFQLLTNFVAGRNRLSSTPGMGDISLPLNFTSAAPTSRLLKDAPPEVYSALQADPVTYNTHNYGIHQYKFDTQTELKDFFTVLSTNTDTNNKEFASMIEGKDYPMYGTQWHPEKNSFDWNPTRQVDHSLSGIRACQYLANFFVDEARKNNHHFPSVSDESHALIQNENRRFFTSGKFYENFYIDYSTK